MRTFRRAPRFAPQLERSTQQAVAIRKALAKSKTRKCPVHGIPDCLPPLLNGCSWKPEE